MKSFEGIFEEITGFRPYNFQNEMINKFCSGKNIILQAPTGSGKTWASIIPFIIANKEGITFPKKLIYSLPLRTLANSLHDTVSKNKFIKENSIKVALQTGENPDDRFFESDIIFTTIDQTLSSILGFPYALPQKLANVNAGAVISSYLIFDEFHLLDPERSLTTTANLLKKLRDIAPFCLMTATLSKSILESLAKHLDAEIVEVGKDEIKTLKNYGNKKIISIDSNFITAEKIIQHHNNRSIVITNTVGGCQEIYHDLMREKYLKDAEIICIHSRFFQRDRQGKENRIKELFGEDSNANAILISTQVIEVGIDISCEVMHTEISPINSLLQRVGRCARFGNESGEIYIYDVKPGNNGKKSYLPYAKVLCECTFQELKKREGESLNYFIGQEIVDEVLTEKELKDFEIIQTGKEHPIREAWSHKDKRFGRELIRDINSVNLILLSKREHHPDSPFNYEMLSMNPHSLKWKLQNIEVADEDWLIATIQENNFIDFDEGLYTFAPIDIDQIAYINPVILNSKYVGYNKEIGLNFLGEGKDFNSQKVSGNKELPKYSYQKDTYQEHIESMITVYERDLKLQNEFTFSKLEEKIYPTVSLDELMKFIIILHDYGKLNKKWQDAAINFQRTKGYVEGEILAHTDFDVESDKRLELPPHAGIGAMAAWHIFEEATDALIDDEPSFVVLAKAISTSIIQHHSAKTHTTIPYQIEDKNKNMVVGVLQRYCPNLMNFNLQDEVLTEWKTSEPFEKFLVQYDTDVETFLYFVLVRILRLCDQKSFDVLRE